MKIFPTNSRKENNYDQTDSQRKNIKIVLEKGFEYFYEAKFIKLLLERIILE